jgi:hypothetical protein
MVFFNLDFSWDADALGEVWRSCLASPYEEFIFIAFSQPLDVSVESIQFLEVAKVIADADRWVDAFDFAGSKRSTEISLLDFRHLRIGLLNVVGIKVNHWLSIVWSDEV